MKQVIIGMSRAKNLLEIGSTIIKDVEKEPYSHVYIKLVDGITGLTMIFQATSKTVNTMTFENFCSINLPVREYILNVNDNIYLEILTMLQNKLGTGYGFISLIAIGIKKLFRTEINLPGTDNTLICSELGALVAKQDGIVVPDQVKFVTPSDLEHLLIANNIPRIL